MNPSFEDTVACPDFYSEVYNCVGWYSCGITPDYYNLCNTDWVGIPDNFVGHQYAATGHAYCGVFAYNFTGLGEGREIIGTQLSSPLTIGTRYFVNMKVSLADSVVTASNNLGVLFTTFSMQNDTDSYVGSTHFPQVYSQAVITDYTNWVTVSGSFVADSAYQFIEIGNFLNDNLTTAIPSPSPAAYYCCSYYYIDDVCVSTDSLTCPISVGIKEPQQTVATISPNPFSTQLTFSLADNEPRTISLYNFLGQQVLQQTFTNSTTINTEQLADGIYFYELRNNKGTLKTGKVVKQ